MELIILLFYVIAGFFDCYLKEGAKEKLRRLYPDDPHKQWLELPGKFHHHNNWHLIVISLWLIPILIFGIFIDHRYLIFLIPFYLEDFFYYVFSWILFKQWIPEKLDWLYGDIKLYEKILESIFNVENFTRKTFYKVLSFQIVVFFILYFILFVL